VSRAKKQVPATQNALTFEVLVQAIHRTHNELAAQAGRAVNISLTLRNWLIGWHIVEYEQRGADRAAYGEKLLESLSLRLHEAGVSRSEERELRRYRQFYQTYPQIRESVTPELKDRIGIQDALPPKAIRETVTPELTISGIELISRLSFTHIVELLKCDDDLQRAFYESECIRGGWSVRELQRQIASLYCERIALSQDKAKLTKLTDRKAEVFQPQLAIRDPYIFEFLGLRSQEVMSESHLEDQLLDKLQEFLLELGHGFCFEARQKRILIGDTHGFVDLVFYHRILKCHVLIDLKLEEFSHENIGQLNTYVSWYRKHMMTEGDNDPVGILLCAQKDHALVEYALAGIDNQLFVSKYQLHLPDREQLRRELEQRMREFSE
jgi:predicted nuclease of restriction endonuclease-like (RecB) superfamily